MATGDQAAALAAARAAELFLSHRMFRASTTGEPIRRRWLTLHYPSYWHYDVLQGLVIICRLGHGTDPRTADALDILEQRRLSDGRWRPGAYWWRSPDGAGSGPADAVDWGRSKPNPMLTLNALQVLRAAGRWH